MSGHGSWFRGASWVRNLRLGTRYRGGRTRLGRRAVPGPTWPYLVILIAFVLVVLVAVVEAFIL